MPKVGKPLKVSDGSQPVKIFLGIVGLALIFGELLVIIKILQEINAKL